MSRTPSRLPVAVLVTLTLLPATLSHAQESQVPGYVPPVVRFDSAGIPLMEAVRITLENSPEIKLEEATVLFQTGVLRENRGRFDWTFGGGVSYEYRQQELTDSVKKQEQKQRDDARKAVDSDRANQEGLTAAVAALDSAVGPNGQLNCDPKFCSSDFLSQYQYTSDLIQTFKDDPDRKDELIKIRDELVAAEQARLRTALNNTQTDFDERETALRNLGDTPQDEVIQDGKFQVGVTRTLRNGIGFTPFFDTTFQSDRYKGKPVDADFGGKGLEDLFTSRAGISFTVPLLRGGGRAQFAASEHSAEIEREARVSALQHQAAVSVLRTVQAYWSLRAAQDNVAVDERSVALEQRLVQVTQDLVDAGELAAVEMSRVGASLARSRGRLEDSQRALIQARVALAQALGVAVTSERGTLPLAADDFPEVGDSAPPSQQELADLLADAVRMRRDLQAFRLFADSGVVLTRAAELERRALLNLTASTWMTALGETVYGKSLENWVGPSVSADLTFEVPIGNNIRKGRHDQARADLRRREIDLADLERVIELSVVQEIRVVDDAIDAVQRAQESVEFYRRTVDAQFDLLRAGEITLVDAILTEDQQAGVQRDLVAARSALARIIAQLRFETGSLISYSGDTSQVAADTLTTLPSWR